MTQQIHPAPAIPTPRPYGQPGPAYGAPATPFCPPAGPHPGGGYGGVTPPKRKRTGLVVGAAAGAVVLTGGLIVGGILLFGDKTLDTAAAETQISQLVVQETGVTPTDVSCPTDITAEAGNTFSCTAALEGQPLTFEVSQTDDQGNVEIQGQNTFVVIEDLQASLADAVGTDVGVAVTAECPADGHTVLIDAVGTPITCTVTNTTNADDNAQVNATVDAQGSVSYEWL